jgi:hypothetical protein
MADCPRVGLQRIKDGNRRVRADGSPCGGDVFAVRLVGGVGPAVLARSEKTGPWQRRCCADRGPQRIRPSSALTIPWTSAACIRSPCPVSKHAEIPLAHGREGRRGLGGHHDKPNSSIHVRLTEQRFITPA